MMVRELLHFGTSSLAEKGVETPFLDATVLLAHAFGSTKERLFSSLPDMVAETVEAVFRGFLELRFKGIPVAYIRKKKEFFGLEYYVDERVFVPRPDTETLVEAALRLIQAEPWIKDVHDACTGSGCVAIALKHECPFLNVSASDISENVESVFKINCHNILGHEIPFSLSRLLFNVRGSFDMIVSNPPYLTDSEVKTMQSAGWPEPALALQGGTEGLDILIELIKAAMASLKKGGSLVMEASPGQMPVLQKYLKEAGYVHILLVKDLGGRDRVISGKKR
ncbi:MAG: peptide chain release factor N(5)-glutamine methyltransferase [Spirochaetota bacterium]